MAGATTALDAFTLRFRALNDLNSFATPLHRLLESQLEASRYIPNPPSSLSPSSGTTTKATLESIPLLLPRPLAKSLDQGPIRDQGISFALL